MTNKGITLRVLITGGTGFLGRAVTRELLAHDHTVTALSRGVTVAELPPEVRTVYADLTDAKATALAIAENPADVVIHLAGRTNARESFADPVGYYTTNVSGTINLLAALGQVSTEGHRPGVILASTHAVYGSQRVSRLSETNPTQPESPYAASKVSCEQLLGFHARTGLIGAVVLRYFNIAGALKGIKDPDQSRIIPRILRAASMDQDVPLNGDGSAQRDFIHIADVAAATRLAMEGLMPGHVRTYNVGTGHGTSIKRILAEASAALGKKISTETRPPVDEPEIVVADIASISANLGWSPSALSSIGTMIRDTISE